MKIIIGSCILEDGILTFENNNIKLVDEDDFSNIVLNTSSRIVHEFNLKIDHLNKSVKNNSKYSCIVNVYDGIASEDYISAYMEYTQNKSEKSFRVIMGLLLLLYQNEYPKYTGKNYRKVELSEAMQIAQYLIVNSNYGLLSQKEVIEYHTKKLEYNKNKFNNFSSGLDSLSPQIEYEKNQNKTMLIYADEITLEGALSYISSDIMISKEDVSIEVLNHCIKYNLKTSDFLENLKNKIEDDKKIHYNGDYYRLSNILYFGNVENKALEPMIVMRILSGGTRYPMFNIMETI